MASRKRIALIMGGGVSLGSFSGGALMQVLRLLEHLHEAEAEIDVVTGASAGSMTLGIAVYHLYRGSDLATIAADLKRAWVEEISAEQLVPKARPRHSIPSLFADTPVHQIAAAIMQFEDRPAEAHHPLLADELLASFALTNLNGIAARAEGQMIRQTKAGGGSVTGPGSVFADALQTTFHQDVMRFRVRRTSTRDGEEAETISRDGFRELSEWESDARSAGWSDFRAAAIASGAFPAAFPPVRLRRERQEYRLWPDDFDGGCGLPPIDSFWFDYVDGGVLRNEPLREAIELAAIRDRGQEREVDRVFIFIDPHVSGTSEAYTLPFNQPLALRRRKGRLELDEPPYVTQLGAVLGRFAGMLASQAAFRDWLKAARVNSQVEWRARIADELLPHLQLRPASYEAGGSVLDRLIVDAYLDRARRRLTGDDAIPDLSTDQIARVFRQGPDQAGLDPAQERALRPLSADLDRRRREVDDGDFPARLLLLIDLVGNLRDKQELNLVAITPASAEEPVPLAGSFLANFGGFFDREYRQHDFEAGAHVADRVLRAPIPDGRPDAADRARPFLERDLPPELTAPKPHLASPADYRQIERSERRRFERMIRRHIGAAARAGGQGLVVRGLARWFGGNKVRDSLQAREEGRFGYFALLIDDAPAGSRLEGFNGGSARAWRSGQLATVVGVHLGGGREEIFGPHVDRKGAAAWRLRFHRSPVDFRGVEIRLEGDPGDWLRAVGRCSIPEIVLSSSRLESGLTLTVTDVGDRTAGPGWKPRDPRATEA